MAQVDFYTMLSGIGDQFAKVRQQRAVRDLAGAIARGEVDERQALALAPEAGEAGLTLVKYLGEMRKRDEGRQAMSDFGTALGGMFRPTPAEIVNGSAPQQQPSVPQPARNDLPAFITREPVKPSPKTWGDEEGVKAGVYDPEPTSSTPAAARPAQAASAQAALPARSGFTDIGIQHVPMLMQQFLNPRLPDHGRELAGKLLTRALDSAKEPDKIRTLNALKEQSQYPGTILDLERDLRSSSKPQVTINQTQETAEAKGAGELAAKRRGAMFDAASAAPEGLQRLARVETLLNQVEQGKLAPGKMTVSAWARSFGLNDDFAKGLGLDPAKVGDAQAVNSLLKEMVVGRIGPGGLPANNFSEADRDFITDMAPKLANDPRANKLMISTARRVYQMQINRANEYSDWKNRPENKGKSFEDFETGYANRIARLDNFGDLRREAEKLLGPEAAGGAPVTSGTVNGLGWKAVR